MIAMAASSIRAPSNRWIAWLWPRAATGSRKYVAAGNAGGASAQAQYIVISPPPSLISRRTRECLELFSRVRSIRDPAWRVHRDVIPGWFRRARQASSDLQRNWSPISELLYVEKSEMERIMRYGLLWLLGVPIPLLILIWFFFH